MAHPGLHARKEELLRAITPLRLSFTIDAERGLGHDSVKTAHDLRGSTQRVPIEPHYGH